MRIVEIAFLSWIILTALRILVHIFWTKIIGGNWPRGYWVLLVPQILLIFIFSFLFIIIFPLQHILDWFYIGICWIIYTLVFEFVGVLVFGKDSLSLLFEGWKIWKGNIWVLVLLSHLFAPYLISSVINIYK